MIGLHRSRYYAFAVLVQMLSGWPGLGVHNVAFADAPAARLAAPKLVTPPPPPLKLAKSGNSAAKESAVVPAGVDPVSKAIYLRLLDNMKQSMEEFLSGGFNSKEIIFLALGVASIGLACAAMILESSLLVDILAWTCLIVGPSAAILQRKVSLLEGMREITNKLRAEVNEISSNNAILQAQNRRLTKNTKKLKNTQSALEEISASQGISIDKLVNQVNEYKQIQQDIKTDLRSKVQQTLLNVFMRSDKDEDFVISPEEENRLIMRLKGIPAVEFDEEKFRKALRKEGGDIMKFADKYFGHDAPLEKHAIFKF